MCRPIWLCLPGCLTLFSSYEQHRRRERADDPGVWKALTSSRCLSICRTAAAKLVSHTGGIAHTHAPSLSHARTHAHTRFPWIDLIQPLNSASTDSRTGSVLERTAVWNRYPRGGLRSELWLTSQQVQAHNGSSEIAGWNLFELTLTTSLIRLKLGLKPCESIGRGRGGTEAEIGFFRMLRLTGEWEVLWDTCNLDFT